MDAILAKGKKMILIERDKMITQDKPTKNKDDPVDGFIRVTASLVGFASEVHQHSREKEYQSSQYENRTKSEKRKSDSSTQPSTLKHIEESHETIWQQDDSHSSKHDFDETRSTKSKGPSKDPRKIAYAFVQKHPFNNNENLDAHIDQSVVLPQRRPNKRSRGFVRAYAPVLASASITQDMFLEFVDNLNRVLEPNPWLNAINVVGLAANAIPDVLIGALVGLALDTTTDAAMEANSRSRSHTYMNYMNRDFFVPRGLISFIAIWDPHASQGDEPSTVVDFSGEGNEPTARTSYGKTVKNAISKERSASKVLKGLQQQMETKIQPSSGTFDWLEPAPLIFPSAIETAAELKADKDGKQKNAFDRGEIWLDDFVDKRSQAKWNEENPNAPGVASMPEQVFRSRYADPNHAASTGDPVAFVTGGRWSLIDKRRLKDERKAEEKKLRDEEKSIKEEEKKNKVEEKVEAEEKAKEEKKKTKQDKKLAEKAKKKDGEKKDNICMSPAVEPGQQKTSNEIDPKTNLDRAKGEQLLVEKQLKEQQSQESGIISNKQVSQDTTNLVQSLMSSQNAYNPNGNDPKRDAFTHDSKEACDAELKSAGKKEKEREKPSSAISGLLKKNILYLVIVNIPPSLRPLDRRTTHSTGYQK